MILLVAATSEISDPQDIFWRMVPYSLGQQNVSAGVEGGLWMEDRGLHKELRKTGAGDKMT